MQKIIFVLTLLITTRAVSQELYVFSEPASNMPAKSISLKLTGHFISEDKVYARPAKSLMPAVMFGLSKKVMLHVGGTFANMNTANFKPESFFVYAKYRFLSNDDVHEHFRMAAFVQGSYTKVLFHTDEISLMGDKRGVALGLIATQLLNKIAISGTVSHTQLLDPSRFDDVIYIPKRSYQAMNYSLSAGYLVLPKEYTSYKQLNLNLYLELLAQQTIDPSKYYIDMAPAVQLIFNSNTKLNIGYRFQLGSDMNRMSKTSLLVSFERTFLNALAKR